MPRRKILHLVVAGAIGGAERFLIELASRSALTEADHVAAVISPNPELASYLRRGGIEVHHRPCRSEGGLTYLWQTFGPREVGWLQRMVHEQRVDLLHLHTFGSHVLGARLALACGIPAIRTEHGVRHYRDPTCALYRHWSLRQTARVVAVSKFVGGVVASIAPRLRDRIRVVHNGVDTGYFDARPSPASAVPTALVLARLEREKRIDLALEALGRVSGLRLRIVGEGSHGAALRALARRLSIDDRVEFAGYEADPRASIATSDVLLNCTRQEGFGLSIIEAAAMGRPAIAFDGGGIPEVIEHGCSGWVVKNHTADDLAATLDSVARDCAALARCGAAARARVERLFTIEAMCRNYAAIYREVLDEARAAA